MLKGFVVVVLVAVMGVAIGAAEAEAVERPWPQQWVNPSLDATYEDWGFASCNPPYNGDRSHLGTDAQGQAPAGSPIRAIAPGTVVNALGGYPGDGVAIVHQSSGGQFVAFYAHIVGSVPIGAHVAAGQQIGTLYDWTTADGNASNEHLHLGVWPVPDGADPESVPMVGSAVCTNGTTDAHGYVDPIPWLADRNPINITDEGTWVSPTDSDEVYVIAGGAPIYVPSGSLHDGRTIVPVTPARFDALNDCPTDGTYLTGIARQEVYVVAGCAPIHVSSWDHLDGQQDAVAVDDTAIDRAGDAGPYEYLSPLPDDGTFLRRRDGPVYVTVGGAPIFVSDWENVGGQQPTTLVDSAAIDNAGAPGVWRFLRSSPADGHFVRRDDGATFMTAGGALLFVSDWSHVGGQQPTTLIDGAAIANAGGSDVWRFLEAHPVDGTILRTDNGDVYVVAGGAAAYVSSWDAIGGPRATTMVDVAAITNAGGGDVYASLRAQPLTGTVLRRGTGQQHYWVADGRAYPTNITTGAVQVDPYVLSDSNDDDLLSAVSSDELDGSDERTWLNPLSPARVLDTRAGQQTVDREFEGEGRVRAGSTTVINLAGRLGVPGDAEAALLNVTAVAPDAPGYLTVHPCADRRPTASNVNYGAGDVAPNAVLADLDATGTACVFSSAPTDLVIDLNGFVPNGGSTTATEPARLLDTRSGTNGTVDDRFDAVGRIPAGGSLTVPIAGRGGVPADAAGAVLNVTAVASADAGYLTVWACGARPNASNVNYSGGDVAPNLVVTDLDRDGDICLYSRSSTDVVVDVAGFIPDGGVPRTITPARLLDSRDDRRVPADGTRRVRIAGRGGVSGDATSAVLNVTAVAPGADGYLTVWPCDQDRPNASSVNYTAGGVSPNAVVAKLDANGGVCVYSRADTDLVVDVSAYT